MNTSLAIDSDKCIAAAMTEEEVLDSELQMVNVARLKCKIKATLKNNENREFLTRHL